MRRLIVLGLAMALATPAAAQESVLLRPDRVFDGEAMQEGWSVLVENGRITGAGPSLMVIRGTRIVELPGLTLLPGLIEGHSHLLLHPYDETSWTDQVLLESHAERVARGTVHARATLMAGVTTVRDLGSEGLNLAGLAKAIRMVSEHTQTVLLTYPCGLDAALIETATPQAMVHRLERNVQQNTTHFQELTP